MASTMTDASMSERLRGLQGSARVCAEVNGHRLGRWTRDQTGRRTLRQTSATCHACGRTGWARVGAFETPDHTNEYGGDAVAFRCAAIPGNVCQFDDVAPTRRTDGTVGPCDRPYVAVWSFYGANDGPGRTLRACAEHSRTYRRIAESVPSLGWRQTAGPIEA